MPTPRILIIAGSDSGGGAGIQADIKTVTMFGGHAMTAVTALTAQNTLGVQAVHPIPPEMVVAQMKSCIDDISVDAIKIGMLGSPETAHAVADMLETLSPAPTHPRHPGLEPGSRYLPGASGTPGQARGDEKRLPIVFDPVMVATSGATLADAPTIAAFARLMRLATLVTPNLPELAALGGEAAVLAHGPALLIKGGHAEGDRITDQLRLPDGRGCFWTADRIDTPHTHGTGCTLASAIATGLGAGLPLSDAIDRARLFVRVALREAPGLGRGHGPMGHGQVRLDLGAGPRLNQVTLGCDDYAASRTFYAALGLTGIVDSADRYARFEAAGGATLSVSQGTSPAIYLEHEDLDAAVAAAQAAGIVFDALPTDQRWLWREAWTRDPAGNRVCLFHAGEARRFPPWRIG